MRCAWALLLLIGCAAEDVETPEVRAPAFASAPAETPVPELVDAAALAELLHAAPREHPPSTGPDGTTLVGSDTLVPAADGDASAPPSGTSSAVPRVLSGTPEFQPQLSTPAIERAAREQIYWALSKKCRDDAGELPPPESVTLVFTIRSDGSVDPASVAATSDKPAYEAIAECVLREFSALPFRGPTATLHTTARILVTWPSVD